MERGTFKEFNQTIAKFAGGNFKKDNIGRFTDIELLDELDKR